MGVYSLTVRRYDPEAGKESYWDTFDVEIGDDRSVLAAILKHKDSTDASIGVRCSCQAGICGSCGVRINGKSALACNTLIADAQKTADRKDGEIVVEPMTNMPIIKDLIVDMDEVHWKKVRGIDPWLKPTGDPPAGEYVVPQESMIDVTQTMACIQCGVCVSSCLALEVDPEFTGPAALAKTYRFVGDPRDGDRKGRLEKEARNPHGMYDCTHCFSCVEACPKDVAPMNQIMRLRRKAIHDFDINDPNNGRRHEEAFVKIIRRKGMLDESKLFQDSHDKKDPRPLIQGIPTALRGLAKGKMSPRGLVPGLGHAIPGRENLKPIFEHTEEHFEQFNLYVEGEEEETAAIESNEERSQT